MGRRMRILGAMFQGGGNIPLLMPIMARLVERGHTVRIIAGPGIRRLRLAVSTQFAQRIAESGASLIPFHTPDKHPFDDAPPLRGLLGNWVPRPVPGNSSLEAKRHSLVCRMGRECIGSFTSRSC